MQSENLLLRFCKSLSALLCETPGSQDQERHREKELALNGLSEIDRKTLVAIYSDGDTLADCVYKQAKERGVKQDCIWKLIGDVERKIAKRRGLL